MNQDFQPLATPKNSPNVEAKKIAEDIVKVVGDFLNQQQSARDSGGYDTEVVRKLVKNLQDPSQLTNSEIPESIRLVISRIKSHRVEEDVGSLRELIVLASSFADMRYQPK